MSESAMEQVITQLVQELAEQMTEVRETKRMINRLCKKAGLDERYPDANDEGPVLGATRIRSDLFYGKTLAAAAKEYLNMRKARHQGAATINEIYGVLQEGGYKFEAKNDNNAKRSMRITLTKSDDFHKLPNGTYGLSEWYPARMTSAEKKSSPGDEQNDSDNGDAGASED